MTLNLVQLGGLCVVVKLFGHVTEHMIITQYVLVVLGGDRCSVHVSFGSLFFLWVGGSPITYMYSTHTLLIHTHTYILNTYTSFTHRSHTHTSLTDSLSTSLTTTDFQYYHVI